MQTLTPVQMLIVGRFVAGVGVASASLLVHTLSMKCLSLVESWLPMLLTLALKCTSWMELFSWPQWRSLYHPSVWNVLFAWNPQWLLMQDREEEASIVLQKITEIFPSDSVLKWLWSPLLACGLEISLVFLPIYNAVGWGVFLIFVGIIVCSFIFTYFYVPDGLHYLLIIKYYKIKSIC